MDTRNDKLLFFSLLLEAKKSNKNRKRVREGGKTRAMEKLHVMTVQSYRGN